MLRIENVNKYFNRHRKNQIHVINNTSLELGETGLVALLGPSGCGKTTLLNAIGGLDKVNKGKIYINGKRITRRRSSYIDKVRVTNIGYIFQDYNLLDDMSVYDNVALSLKMIGIKKKSDIKVRVDYVLEKVGMYRYRNKLAGNLSGGQRQRVGIARALVKNPNIIIADEPTGNLDSKNTIEVMNIIKSISKDKLVILVTHEKDLAYFYASRIIDIEDGTIKDNRENIHENELDYRIDNNIYLKDFKNEDIINKDNLNIKVYSDNKEDLDVSVVIKNGNIYIKSNTILNIEKVDDTSSIEFIDGHYKKMSKKDYEAYSFDIDKLDNKNHKVRYTSIFNIFTLLKSSLDKILNYSMIKKILLLGFFASSMFILYAVSNIFGVLNIDESKYIVIDKNYLIVNENNDTYATINALREVEGVKYVIPTDSKVSMQLDVSFLYQFYDERPAISGSLTTFDNLSNIIIGNMPTIDEIAIDKSVIDKVINEDNTLAVYGLKSYNDYIGKTFKIGNKKYIVSAITDNSEPCIYINQNDIYDRIIEYKALSSDVEYKNYANQDKVTLKRGYTPSNMYEAIINYDMKDSYQIGKYLDTKVNGEKLKVVGYYTSKYQENSIYVSNETYYRGILSNIKKIAIYTSDKDSTKNTLESLGYRVTDENEVSKTKYMKSVNSSIKRSIIIASILLVISFVEIFLMIRATFLSRVKEVGIYRAIGVKKKDIYKMFVGEILTITTLAGIPGFILMWQIIRAILEIKYIGNNYLLDIRVLLISLILMYGLNVLIGLLPIKSTIRKTPAQILSRNDVD